MDSRAPDTECDSRGPSPKVAFPEELRRSGDWFGQNPPGPVPEPFAKDLFSAVSPFVETCDFSPDGRVCIISIGSSDYRDSRLLLTRRIDGRWTDFESPAFAEEFAYANEPVFSYDGSALTITACRRPEEGKSFFRIPIIGDSWGQPLPMPEPVSSRAHEFRPCFLPDGSLYFASSREGLMNQLYRADRDAQGAFGVAKLPEPINTGNWECDPCVTRDGRILVFSSGRDGLSSDLYICRREADGGWSAPVNAGPDFNSSADEYGAHFSHDESLLFFTRHRPQGNEILWVSAAAIAAI